MGYILAMTAVILWSFNLVIADYFAATLTPFELAFGRWLIAVVVLLPFTLSGIIRNYKVLLRHIGLILFLAVFGIVLNNTLIYYAGQTSSAIDMGLLDVTGPLFIVILSWIWNKAPIKIMQVIGLLLACWGVVEIVTNGDLRQLGKIKPVVGNLLMLINCFIFAEYSVLQSRRPKDISQAQLLEVSAIIGTIIMLPLMLATTPKSQLLALNAEEFLVILYLGIANSVIAFLAWNIALNKIGSIKTGVIYYLMPLFGGIEAHFALGEKLYSSEVIGGIFILAGVICTTIADLKKKSPPARR